MSKKQQPPLLAQIISVSGALNRDEKLALIKYLMIELGEPLYTTKDVMVLRQDRHYPGITSIPTTFTDDDYQRILTQWNERDRA